jgi:hypothetical protein
MKIYGIGDIISLRGGQKYKVPEYKHDLIFIGRINASSLQVSEKHRLFDNITLPVTFTII